MKRTIPPALIALSLLILNPVHSESAEAPKLNAELLRGLPLRNIGPALEPGRIADIAVDPRNRSVWYVATASSGLWKTRNRGESWEPIFDDGGSYSLGCVTLDPNHPDVVWLGSGENQALRSVSFGTGLYKSTDAGETWNRVGLTNSEHIQKVLVDPRNSDVVFVAAQGPLWAAGGDRGLFKTTDGGKTWKAVLTISENTGVTDACFDPRNPDVIYAASYQRRRNVGLLIGGGPEAGIFKSKDGGATWTKLTNGIPSVDLGRIALAVSPQQPDVVYAVVTAAGNESGFFRSADAGATWVRQSSFRLVDPQYYGELYADPHTFDKLYIIDSRTRLTEDGGKTTRFLPWNIHVDHHAIDLDPTDANHILFGNDGGLYETYDNGRSWRHFVNMPTMQFYAVALDNAVPFYNVYGGSQDNGTVGGPSRTLDRVGIRTSDWIAVGGGDGMQPRVDPEDPAIVYSMSQNGAITRLDKRTSATTAIRPRINDREMRLRWNWDSPFIISPHLHTRLYLAGSRLFRSDDRGDNWRPVSPDLTRQIDRDTLPVMGRMWDTNAVTKNLFTTDLSVCSALSESPLREGLLFVGTDDGLVQISDDGGSNWVKIAKFPGVPELTTVSDLFASQHDVNTLYAAFNNYQRGDFKPYLLKSTDRGRTWASIASNLPEWHFVWCIFEDPVNRNLLFAGTEFGLFVSVDGGAHWMELRGGMPTVAVRDLEIQRRESDLVCATFGRGMFILDDLTPLRQLSADLLTKEAALLPLRHAYVYNEINYTRAAWGNYVMTNPGFGAAFTYYLRDNATNDSKIVLSVADAEGKEVRKVNGSAEAGLHRVAWDLRGEGAAGAGRRGRGDVEQRDEADEEEVEEAQPQSATTNELQMQREGEDAPPDQPAGRGFRGRGFGGPQASLVKPGQYKVTLTKVVNGVSTPLAEPQSFEVVPLPGK
jgi:photosystem II stability/assembly factor-like uncharacterized protein